MIRFISWAVWLCCMSVAAQPAPTTGKTSKCTASVYNAQDYVGQRITVCGYVAQVSTIDSINGVPTYINMGGKYPHHSFTAVIWKKNLLSFEGANLQDYTHQLVAITGEVVLYKGKPQITVYTPKQIEVVAL